MTITRLIRAAAVATAGALVTLGAAQAAPALNLATGATTSPATEATPVYHGGYNTYYNPGYHYRPYYQPYYQPPYRPYYRPYYGNRYYNNYGYNQGYRYRNDGGIYIRTPGLRLGIGF